MGRIRTPLERAAHLEKLYNQYSKETEDEVFMFNNKAWAVLYRVEAEALTRGYFAGRVMAAYDVRMGLDSSFGNGSVHFDSDNSPPPLWLISTAEHLARGDSR